MKFKCKLVGFISLLIIDAIAILVALALWALFITSNIDIIANPSISDTIFIWIIFIVWMRSSISTLADTYFKTIEHIKND